MTDIMQGENDNSFEAYWEIPYGEETAMHGKWKKGPPSCPVP